MYSFYEANDRSPWAQGDATQLTSGGVAPALLPFQGLLRLPARRTPATGDAGTNAMLTEMDGLVRRMARYLRGAGLAG
jgi:hypothetical protein